MSYHSNNLDLFADDFIEQSIEFKSFRQAYNFIDFIVVNSPRCWNDFDIC